MSSHTEAGYNKLLLGKGTNFGTLVGNWSEEKSMREFTGVGRTIVREHIPKRLGNFEEPIKNTTAMDNTTLRIYGELKDIPMSTEGSLIGTGKNPADSLPRHGRKTMNQEQEIMAKVAEEMKQKEAAREAVNQQRFFETTSRANFTEKDQCQNTIGRRVMKNQNGQTVGKDQRDEQLVVEHGIWRRAQKTSDDDLSHRVPKGDYTQTQPITYYTHMADRKHYRCSAGVGQNQFARTSGFTQTADATKSIAGYYGNIDFEQESQRTGFRQSVGKDLNVGNPYVNREISVSNFSDITQRVVEICKQQQAANGLRGLRVFFRSMDRNQDGLLDPAEFRMGMKAFGCEITEDEMHALLKYFDTNKDGKISLNEMLHAMRSNSLNATRQACVEKAYNKLDKTGRQMVTIADLKANYDCSPNPQFQSGLKTCAQLCNEFINCWDTAALDGVISEAEFIDYYRDVSPSIISDSVFENMVKNTWNL